VLTQDHPKGVAPGNVVAPARDLYVEQLPTFLPYHILSVPISKVMNIIRATWKSMANSAVDLTSWELIHMKGHQASLLA